MRYLVSLISVFISIVGLGAGLSLVWPPALRFLSSSVPIVPWSDLAVPLFGLEANISAGLIAGGSIVFGFLLNGLYFKARNRKSGKSFHLLNMISGYFWGLVLVGIAALLVGLAYFTYVQPDVETSITEGRRIRVHWVIALFVHGYFYLLEAIGTVWTAILCMVLALLVFWGGLSFVAEGDDEESEIEDQET